MAVVERRRSKRVAAASTAKKQAVDGAKKAAPPVKKQSSSPKAKGKGKTKAHQTNKKTEALSKEEARRQRMQDLKIGYKKWPSMLSEPNIFEEYTHELGLLNPNWKFYDVLGPSDDMKQFIPGFKPESVRAVILCTPMQKEPGSGSGSEDHISKVKYFMKQPHILGCACGLIAIFHSIFNNMQGDADELKLSGHLKKFWSKTKDQSPEQRAESLSKESKLSIIHRKYADGDDKPNFDESDKKGEYTQNHYLTFTLNDEGDIMEYDGYENGPAVIKTNCTRADFLTETYQSIMDRCIDPSTNIATETQYFGRTSSTEACMSMICLYVNTDEKEEDGKESIE
mmetsp:Transcript_9682/g.28064  ORF Transcript_9682/g.28064 Transcript_9682/m.28064 type:complete len:340 (+) Transcript_9682:38-1057(+)